MLLDLALAYAAVGLLFAIQFVSRGVTRVDSVAKNSTLGFRLMILPGAAALWPALLLRQLKGGG